MKNRQCHITRRKLPCNWKKSHCPLEDPGFIAALYFYAWGPIKELRCLAGKLQRMIDGVWGNFGCDRNDIAMLFPGTDEQWKKSADMYLQVGLCYMDKDLCHHFRIARQRWFKRFGPPGSIQNFPVVGDD